MFAYPLWEQRRDVMYVNLLMKKKSLYLNETFNIKYYLRCDVHQMGSKIKTSEGTKTCPRLSSGSALLSTRANPGMCYCNSNPRITTPINMDVVHWSQGYWFCNPIVCFSTLFEWKLERIELGFCCFVRVNGSKLCPWQSHNKTSFTAFSLTLQLHVISNSDLDT